MKQKIYSVVLGGILLWSAAQAFSAPDGVPHVYKTVEGRTLTLFVLKPPDWNARDTRPAILFFHGGGWVSGKPQVFNRQAVHLASRGMVAILVEYRLLEKGTSTPPLVCIQDARSAMRWVRTHAVELGVDKNRIASAGGSAGGHLAAFVGMMDGLDDPQDNLKVSAKSNAMVLFNPVLDNGPNGWGHRRVGERYREFSPFYNVTAEAPPAIVFLGTEDSLIPVETILAFKAKMDEAGVPCETCLYEGQKHGFFNREPWCTKTLAQADRFFVEMGWLKAPAKKDLQD